MKGSKASLAVLPSEMIWVSGLYLEGAHEVGGVGSFVGRHAGKVVDLVGLVLGVGEQLLQLSDVLPGLPEVEGTEVLVEAVVEQVLGERMTTLSILK